jgi:hypothetical protein
VSACDDLIKKAPDIGAPLNSAPAVNILCNPVPLAVRPDWTLSKKKANPVALDEPKQAVVVGGLTQRNNSSTFSSKLLPDDDYSESDNDRTNAVRSKSYALRTGHRALVKDHHKALGLCGLGTFGEKHEKAPQAHLTCDHYNAKADIRRVSTCGSSWSCPVCAAKNSSRRTRALQPQVKSFMEGGGTAHLLTLTLRHDRGTELSQSLSTLSKAWSNLTSGRAWKDLSEEGDLEWVRGMDVTHGAHGWHPHIHILLLLGVDFGDGDRVAKAILERWREKLAKIGWTSTTSAQDHQRVDSPDKAAAYAVSPASIYEPTAMAMKRARKGSGSRTPFEILDAAVGGDRHAKGLWVDYVKAVKGRQQATCSAGLTFELPEETGDEDGHDPIDIVAGLGKPVVLELDKSGLTAPMLELVEQHAGNPAGVRSALTGFLEKLESKQWRIFKYGEAALEAAAEREDARLKAEHEAAGGNRWTRPLDRFERAVRQRTRNEQRLPEVTRRIQAEVRQESGRAIDRMKAILTPDAFQKWHLRFYATSSVDNGSPVEKLSVDNRNTDF